MKYFSKLVGIILLPPLAVPAYIVAAPRLLLVSELSNMNSALAPGHLGLGPLLFGVNITSK